MLDIYRVRDTRDYSEFKKMSIFKYKISDLNKLFFNNIINQKINYSIIILIELHCSGHLSSIIKILIKIYFNFINLKNPNLFHYFMRRILHLQDLLLEYKKKEYIQTRNNQEIRNLLCELTAILTFCPKSNLFIAKSLPKVKESVNLKSNRLDYIYTIEKSIIGENIEDNDLRMYLNEIIYLLLESKNYEKLMYIYLSVKKQYKDMELFHKIIFKIVMYYIDNVNQQKQIYIKLLIQNYSNKLFNKPIREKIVFMIFYVYLNEINFYKNIIYQDEGVLLVSSKINILYKNFNDKIDKIYLEDIKEKQEEKKAEIMIKKNEVDDADIKIKNRMDILNNINFFKK